VATDLDSAEGSFQPVEPAGTVGAEELHRGLKERHIQMIAIGGAIGVGLFLGSASAIQKAGPSLLLSYAVAGVVIFLIMRALGELLLYRPVSGAFATYAEEFVGPWAGFVTAWTYWLMWVVIAMAEITAVGIYVQFWFPGVPQWLPALIALVVLFGVNLIAVGLFGEFEFWFAMIKVVTIIAMILLGLAIIIFGLRKGASFTNLWSHGGFFPKGLGGPFLALQIVMFAFLGVELLGVTAGEAQNPEKTIPSAINKVIYRILLFYIGALTVIMSLVAWDQLNATSSPFVLVFAKVGIPAAAGIVNFVVLTAALSSCNSGIFSTGRMLYTLAGYRQAPAPLRKVSRQKVPALGMTVSFAVMLLGVVINYFIPARAFIYITSVATVCGLFVWGMTVFAHLCYRRYVDSGRLPPSGYRLPGYPVTNWFVLAFLMLVLVLLGFSKDTRIALYVAPVWAAVMLVAYITSRSQHLPAAPPLAPEGTYLHASAVNPGTEPTT